MDKNVVVIGSGSREHALAHALSQSQHVAKIFVCPGNGGTSSMNEKTSNVVLRIEQHETILNWCRQNNIDLVVIGPEAPLASGLSDLLQSHGVNCFGPSQKASQIEASKCFSKQFFDRHNIPTARWRSFECLEDAVSYVDTCDFDGIVVKASGLAAGKGVIVASTKDEAKEAIKIIMAMKQFGDAGQTVVIEEKLIGEEISVFAFSDGETIAPFPPAQDFKRAHDGDLGPNTGGMGAYCPVKHVSQDMLKFVEEEVLQKTVTGMKKEGYPFVGLLYAGVMLTKDGAKVLEFNCRFGDPETQVVLPLLQTDLYEVMSACCTATLQNITTTFDTNKAAVTVVLASAGYPSKYEKGKLITGLKETDCLPNVKVFHAGTRICGNDVVTNGGRVLSVTATGIHAKEARSRAYEAIAKVKFDGSFYRRDIALLAETRCKGVGYYDCGVDIQAGNSLVEAIKPLAKATSRTGCVSGLGGFGGLFDMHAVGYRDPILVSGTDGVGTKLKVAQECGIHGTVGIDLVAMCVNDIIAQGAEPLFFLDYYACGKLEGEGAKEVIAGIAEGCLQAGCALLGGETAEMPGMYSNDDYDLAGFAVGAVERDEMLPKQKMIESGDAVIGLKSSGIHSNGFSLVRKVVELSGYGYADQCPYTDKTITLGEELLTPTKIYSKSVLKLVKKGLVKAFAHITGGGLVENIPRVLPENLGCELDANKWEIGAVFAWLASVGCISSEEMLRTFNCGLGGILIVAKRDEAEVMTLLQESHEACYSVGCIINTVVPGKPQVGVINFQTSLNMLMDDACIERPLKKARTQRMKVGVLISGSGTNLQSLIDQSLKSNSSAEIVLVISNVAGAYGLQRAIKAGIPTAIISHKDFKKRLDFDMAMLARLKQADVELVCCAGFMRILTGEFVNAWPGRLLNIHPSLLPSFKGMDAHKQVLEAGVRITGCTAHFVVEEVDAGGIIAQDSVQVLPGDTVDILQERVKEKEWEVYPKAMELVASGTVSVVDGSVQFS